MSDINSKWKHRAGDVHDDEFDTDTSMDSDTSIVPVHPFASIDFVEVPMELVKSSVPDVEEQYKAVQQDWRKQDGLIMTIKEYEATYVRHDVAIGEDDDHKESLALPQAAYRKTGALPQVHYGTSGKAHPHGY